MSGFAGQTIWVAGHRGMLGRALAAHFAVNGATVIGESSAMLDLRDAAATRQWLERERPDVAVIAAARVGGVAAYEAAPFDYFSDNLAIALTVTQAAVAVRVPRLVYVASAAAYPEHAPQPIAEGALMTGALDPAHRSYGLAKLAGIEAVASAARQHGLDWFSVLPTNLYGPGGNSDAQRGHVLATLVSRMIAARDAGMDEVVVWGTGAARRDFLHVEDCADAIAHLLGHHRSPEPVNIGSGGDVRIADLAGTIRDIVGFRGTLRFDPDKPEGAARRLVDTARLSATGWQPKIALRDGIAALAEVISIAR